MWTCRVSNCGRSKMVLMFLFVCFLITLTMWGGCWVSLHPSDPLLISAEKQMWDCELFLICISTNDSQQMAHITLTAFSCYRTSRRNVSCFEDTIVLFVHCGKSEPYWTAVCERCVQGCQIGPCSNFKLLAQHFIYLIIFFCVKNFVL